MEIHSGITSVFPVSLGEMRDWHIYLDVDRRDGIMAKANRNLDGRHSDKSGRINKKHGNTKVGSLRKEYGRSFVKGRARI